MKIKSLLMAATAGLLLSVASANAGAFIISGTDSDDHGSNNGTANVGGWLYMQKALENIAGGVTNGNKTVVTLGTSASTAGTAASSAFAFSSLAPTWSIGTVDGTTNITNFFNGTGAFNTGNTGIIMIDSGEINVSGGIDASEEAILTANAAALNAFVGAGGGLFAQASVLGWLSALIPGVTVTDVGSGGDGSALLLTAAGSAAFPGLTNGDLSTGPWHHHFANYSPLSLLAKSDDNFDVIIGGVGGSITNPRVPEPITVTLFGAGLAGVAALRRRKAKKA